MSLKYTRVDKGVEATGFEMIKASKHKGKIVKKREVCVQDSNGTNGRED